jgi:Ca2+/Na+ antiporter
MSNPLNKILNPYINTGAALVTTGILLSLTASLIFEIVWLTAFGLSMIILGVILIALGRSLPRLSPELARLLFTSGSDTISDLLEELGITAKAIYLIRNESNNNGD